MYPLPSCKHCRALLRLKTRATACGNAGLAKQVCSPAPATLGTAQQKALLMSNASFCLALSDCCSTLSLCSARAAMHFLSGPLRPRGPEGYWFAESLDLESDSL